MKQSLFSTVILLVSIQNAMAQDVLAKKMDPTTMTVLGAMVVGVIFAIAWVFYADRREKRRKQRRRGNKSAA